MQRLEEASLVLYSLEAQEAEAALAALHSYVLRFEKPALAIILMMAAFAAGLRNISKCKVSSVATRAFYSK